MPKKYQTYQMDWEFHHRAIVSPLEVDELASKIAAAYEKVRKVIDWKEENLLRRGAIERILKRRLVSEIYGSVFCPILMLKKWRTNDSRIDAQRLFLMVKLPKNNQEIENILNKYIRILDSSRFPQGDSKKHVKNKMEFYTWMLEIAACEIEEILAPAFKENALLNLMTNVIFERNRILPSDKLSDLDRLVQIYIACMRTLYNCDDPIISYNVIKIRFPFWVEETEVSINQVIDQVHDIRQQIETDLKSEEGKQFFK
jgi:hypothetical protein